jgi:hypothetical protein
MCYFSPVRLERWLVFHLDGGTMCYFLSGTVGKMACFYPDGESVDRQLMALDVRSYPPG